MILHLLFWAGVATQAVPADSFRVAQVGEVRVVATERRLDAAIGLAQAADRVTRWPGLGRRTPGEFQLVLVADSAELARLTRGRAPGWGAAVAFPQARTIILRADLPDLTRIVRHEVAHLVLRGAVRSRLPLWFDEGYATLAAGEWDRLAALKLHLSVVVGGVPSLGDLDGQLRAAAPMADRAYGLAATAVSTLAERIPGGGSRAAPRPIGGGRGVRRRCACGDGARPLPFRRRVAGPDPEAIPGVTLGGGRGVVAGGRAGCRAGLGAAAPPGTPPPRGAQCRVDAAR